MVNKKKPERTCIACNEQREKNSFLRIVKSKDGTIEVDETGKKSGRGAYICKSEECLDKAIKSKRLERIFEKEIENELYENIRGVIIGR